MFYGHRGREWRTSYSHHGIFQVICLFVESEAEIFLREISILLPLSFDSLPSKAACLALNIIQVCPLLVKNQHLTLV